MDVILNGERRSCAEGTTVSDLLSELRLGGRRIAVEINRDVVPTADYDRRRIAEGDHVEIIQFVGGG